MKVNFNQPYTDPFGNPMLENGKPVVIRKSLGINLFYVNDKILPLNPEQKFLAYTLSVKIANAEEAVELTAEEAELIDKVAAKTLPAGYYGNIKSLITQK